MRPDRILLPLLDQLTGCLQTQLPDAPCFTGLVSGAFATGDFCTCGGRDSCGMAWVRCANLFPCDKPPVPSTNPTIATPLGALIEVGAYRCVTVPTAAGKMPDVVDQANDTVKAMDDALAIYRAIACCDSITRRPHALTRWQPSGQGDCQGGFWQVVVQLVPPA